MPNKQPKLEAQTDATDAPKITEPTRQAALKLPFRPSVTKDSDGFQLIVTTQRAFWAQFLQPRGLRPDGRRWPVVRHYLGDARTMTVDKARTAALAAKAAIREGRDPHRERLASAASSAAQRSIIPTTVGAVAALYAQSIEARVRLSDRTRRKIIHYVSKAIRLTGGDSVALAAIDTPAVRLMLDAVNSSAFERLEVFDALDRFMSWCVKRELVSTNPCDGIDRDDRPRPGRSRDHTPKIATLRRVWNILDAAPDHIRASFRFLLLNPVRREEAWGLLWSEVNLDDKRIAIRAERMKNRQPHSLPLSEPALAILFERLSCRTSDDRVFAPPSGAKTINWTWWVSHIRAAIDEDKLERSRRFNLHDIRRSFVSALAEGDSEQDERGFDVDLLDQLLSHSRKGVFGVYQRSSRWREKKQPWLHGLSSSFRPSRSIMWCRSVRDDKTGSRGQDGSPSDPDGLGIPSRSAPASPREILIRHLEFALDAFRNDENEGWWLNMALHALEGGMQAWRAETPLERPPGPSLGRPTVVEGDAQVLLRLRAATPGSDCRTEFEKWTRAGKQRARIRYQDADAMAAELIAAMATSSGRPT